MTIKPYVSIARPDHWFKNIFMLPGIVLAYYFDPACVRSAGIDVLLGIAAACLIASGNYIINEILDAPRDMFHPEKRLRPVPSGQISTPVAWVEWGLVTASGLALAFALNPRIGLLGVSFCAAGILYNVPPLRLKDRPYADVLSESINNPLRMAMGWYATGTTALPPASVLLAYWMFGAFLMAIKRFAEYRTIGCKDRAALYRTSFRHYNEERLMGSIFFYGSLFGMLSGFFMARYHIELILATPVVALAMACYLHLGFAPNSPVQNPERLFRQRDLFLLVTVAFLVCTVLLFVEIPAFGELVHRTARQ